jgi:protein TonB
MFDKLIESNSAGAEFKPRRTFFMVSFVVVGIAFLSALVFDLYAAKFDLGTDTFELAELLAPIATDAPEPIPPRQQPQHTNQSQQSEESIRHDAVATIEQTHEVPTTISTTPFTGKTLPNGPVRIEPLGPETDGHSPSGKSKFTGGDSAGTDSPTVAESVKLPDPPPAAKAAPKKHVTQSKGVVNGIAIDLPKPAYSAVARAMNLIGTVNVQVLIDESGNVVSAKAIDGNVIFRPDAERAARRATFKPTLLSDEPVKVTGVIVYKFTK